MNTRILKIGACLTVFLAAYPPTIIRPLIINGTPLGNTLFGHDWLLSADIIDIPRYLVQVAVPAAVTLLLAWAFAQKHQTPPKA